MDIPLLFISSIGGFCSFVMSLMAYLKIKSFFKLSINDQPYYSLPSSSNGSSNGSSSGSSNGLIDPSTTISQLNRVQVDFSTPIGISKPIPIPSREITPVKPRLRSY